MLLKTNDRVFAALNEEYLRDRWSAELLSKETGGEISPKGIRNYFLKGEGKSSQPDQKGTPNIRSSNLDALCKALLGMSYQEALDKYSFDLSNPSNLKTYREWLKGKCSDISVLDMNQPIRLEEIYTEAHFLSSPRRRAELEIAEAFSKSYRKSEDEQKFFLKAADVVTKNRKLMILGLPGAGKSTFLKRLALYHLDTPLGDENVLPVYLRLRTVSSKRFESLLAAIHKECSEHIPQLASKVEDILKEGKLLILLDGLDEVSSKEFDFVYKGIEEILNRYPNNRFIITCRTKSFSEYKFNSFVDVELAQFSTKQIELMSMRWFESREIELPDGSFLSGENFLEDLKNNPSVFELASNPLILTYLLYNYEQNVGSMPKRKITVFKQVVKIICARWDNTRRIKRRDLQEIEELNYLDEELLIQLLSYVAFQGFRALPRKIEWSSYEICELIRDFLERVLDVPVVPDKVLLAIEATNGLIFEDGTDRYIFRTLGLQEFFVANYIVEQRSDQLIQDAIEDKLLKRSWSEIFPLTADRMTNSDSFLQAIDKKIKRHASNDSVLISYLSWLNKTVDALLEESASSAWVALTALIDLDTALYTRRLTKGDSVNRTPFFDLELGIQRFNHARDKTTDNTSKNAIALWLVIIDALAGEKIIQLSKDISEADVLLTLREIPNYLKEILEISEATTIEGELERVIAEAAVLGDSSILHKLESYRESLPSNSNSLKQWKDWDQSFNEFMLEDFNLGHKVEFSDQDYKRLEDHIYANNLLLRCINDSRYTSTISLRIHLVENLLCLEPIR